MYRFKTRTYNLPTIISFVDVHFISHDSEENQNNRNNNSEERTIQDLEIKKKEEKNLAETKTMRNSILCVLCRLVFSANASTF